MNLNSSDGNHVSLSEPGVIYHQGENYCIITVDKSYLIRENVVGPETWKMVIDSYNITDDKEVKYQYGVISRSELKLDPSVTTRSLRTGSSFLISVNITQNGIPLSGVDNVYVDIYQPEEGFGNWHAINNISLDEIKNISDTKGGENLSLIHQKTLYLTEILNIEYFGRRSGGRMVLFDDGTHGDVTANDGIYTNEFTDTMKEGAYTFHFYANGTTPKGNHFERETEIHRHITPEFSPEDSDIFVITIDPIGKYQTIQINVVPMDAYGNYLGPGYSNIIRMSIDWGQPLSGIIDNLDGTYYQEFRILTSMTDQTNISVTLGEKTKSTTWTNDITPAETIIGDDDDDEEEELILWIIIIILIIVLIIVIIFTYIKCYRKSQEVEREEQSYDRKKRDEKSKEE